MSKDWTTDVEKFVPDADAGAIDGIVRYCGIALASPDSSLVAYRGEEEVGRVRENLLKKKLGITRSDAELDKASSTVGDKMKVHHDNNRVTAYYLLADHFGKLSTFKRASTGPAGRSALASREIAASTAAFPPAPCVDRDGSRTARMNACRSWSDPQMEGDRRCPVGFAGPAPSMASSRRDWMT